MGTRHLRQAPCFSRARRVATALGLLAATLTAQTTLRTHFGVTNSDNYGSALTTVGDLNADGFDDYAVGAPNALPQTSPYFDPRGVVVVYSGQDGTVLYSFVGQVGDRLGYGIGGGGDVDGDTIPDLVVGAPGSSGSAGFASVYSGASGTLVGTYTVAGGSGVGRWVRLVDLDQDGRAEVLYSDSASNSLYAVRANGALVTTFAGTPPANGLGTWSATIGDQDGDGWIDLALGYGGANGFVTLFSGRTGAVLRTLSWNGGPVGGGVASPGDIDGDGYADVVAQPYPASGTTVPCFAAFSGRTGAVLWTLPYDFDFNLSAFPIRIADFEDLDQDGMRDLAIGARSGATWLNSWLVVVSGRTGRIISAARCDSAYAGNHLGRAGDIDNDGYTDFLVGDFDPNQNVGPNERVIVYSGRYVPTPRASSITFSPDCASFGATWPILRTDAPPRLGTTVAVEVTRAPPSTPGWFAYDLAPPLPSLLPGGCTLWIDGSRFPSWIVTPMATAANGGFAFNLAVPNAPGLAGFTITAQALLAPSGGAPAIPTGGLMLVLGP